MPFAIEQSMFFIAKRRSDRIVNATALDVAESFSFSIDDVKTSDWQSYIYFSIHLLKVIYDINGVDLYFNSEIPVGAGVSSSSALCVGIMYTIDHLFQLGLTKKQMVDMASQAEHGMGIRGGIMDQYAILHGQKDRALLIDCQKQSHTLVDLATIPYQWMLFNTNVKHNLVDTPYNNRRSQADEALSIINKRTNADKRFIDIKEYDRDLLDDNPLLRKRISHIYTEIKRVEEVKQNILNNDFHRLGQVLNASHRSLSDDYEVSCVKLDFVCKVLQDSDQVLGCRMMGGGFGGSVIALMDNGFKSREVKEKYATQFGLKLDVIPVDASEGVVRLI